MYKISNCAVEYKKVCALWRNLPIKMKRFSEFKTKKAVIQEIVKSHQGLISTHFNLTVEFHGSRKIFQESIFSCAFWIRLQTFIKLICDWLKYLLRSRIWIKLEDKIKTLHIIWKVLSLVAAWKLTSSSEI